MKPIFLKLKKNIMGPDFDGTFISLRYRTLLILFITSTFFTFHLSFVMTQVYGPFIHIVEKSELSPPVIVLGIIIANNGLLALVLAFVARRSGECLYTKLFK